MNRVVIHSSDGTPMRRLMDRAEREAVADLAVARRSPLWPKAVEFLRGYFTPDVRRQIADTVAAKSPDWPAGYHMVWGMGVRNALREADFGEAEFGVRNIDNIYVELVEESVADAKSVIV